MSEDEHSDSELYYHDEHESHKKTVKLQCYLITKEFTETAKKKLRVS